MNINLVMLVFSALMTFVLLFYIKRSYKQNFLNELFIITLLLMLLWNCSLIAQILFSNFLHIPAINFDYIAYIGICFLPVSLFYVSKVFSDTKIKFNFRYTLLLVVPMISLITLWTNNYHHLFYQTYSINLNDTVTGPYTTIHFIYTYTLFGISIINLLKYSIKNAGFFSKQSILLVIGTLLPIVVNLLGTFGIIPMTVYVTPISFSIALLFFAFAIFKFKFLSVTPIAMQRVVDRMSDCFLVINEDNIITDFNNTFLTTFDLSSSEVRNQNILEFLNKNKILSLNDNYVNKVLTNCKTSSETFLLKKDFKITDKYFNVEASGIFSKNSFLGTLVLLKDVTQHILDMQTIEDNQSMLMEKERLASLGQMIGGIAHNLKTPIMSISGAAEGLLDLTKEYDISIGDPEVTNEDHHAIVKDMNEWIYKIKEYTEYMSDVITAVKGQAVNFSDESSTSFTISEAVKYVDVLMKHELKNALVDLDIHMLVDPSISIKGNINSFVQVLNNMISNAIQAYNGKQNQKIDFTIDRKGNDIQFSIQDYGSGIPDSVQDKLFKEMITTKGKNGTGLGLFMSYSNIRAHFNGNITFESKEGFGTKFIISIPA